MLVITDSMPRQCRVSGLDIWSGRRKFKTKKSWATVQNQISNGLLIPFYNIQTDLAAKRMNFKGVLFLYFRPFNPLQ